MAKGKVVSFSNFNPIAVSQCIISLHTRTCTDTVYRLYAIQLFAACLLLVGLILAAVGTGLTQWARFETEREFPDDARSTVSNGRTYKTQVRVHSTTLLFLQTFFYKYYAHVNNVWTSLISTFCRWQ